MTRSLTEAQREYAKGGTGQMRKTGIRRAKQIASQRRFTYDRQPARCASCLQPRDPRSFPICPDCTARRKRGPS